MIPPERFVPAGNVEEARLAKDSPPFIRRRRYTGRRAEGIRFEKRAHTHLEESYPETYVRSPWLHFREKDSAKFRWCQPDGLIFDLPRGIITVVEVKYSHTSDAWWQVRRLYIPVLEKIFGEQWDYQVCELVKWYDGATRFPEPVELASDITRPSKKFKVHIWRP